MGVVYGIRNKPFKLAKEKLVSIDVLTSARKLVHSSYYWWHMLLLPALHSKNKEEQLPEYRVLQRQRGYTIRFDQLLSLCNNQPISCSRGQIESNNWLLSSIVPVKLEPSNDVVSVYCLVFYVNLKKKTKVGLIRGFFFVLKAVFDHTKIVQPRGSQPKETKCVYCSFSSTNEIHIPIPPNNFMKKQWFILSYQIS